MITPARQTYLDALRSGQYTQVRGYLGRIDPETKDVCNCALGVACELFTPEEHKDIQPKHHRVTYFGYGALVPAPVHQALDLDYWTSDLVLLKNDNDNQSFSEIADWLEKLWSKP